MRKTISLCIILLFATSAFAAKREEVRRDFQRTLNLTSGKSFKIDSSLGRINIRTQPQAQADIRAAIRCSADSASEAKSICDQIQINIVENASGVSVTTEYPNFSGRGRRNIGYSVDYDVAIPDATSLDIRNRFGNVAVADVHAGSVIANSNGNVLLTGGRGRQQIQNSFGKVEVRTNTGDIVIHTGNGDVLVDAVTGNVQVRDRFGKVTVTNATGNVTIDSNNGNVEARSIGGTASVLNTFGTVTIADAQNNVTVNNQNGGVQVRNVKGGAVLRTTFDKIVFSDIAKKVEVHASNANVSGDLANEGVSVETTFGAVDLRSIKGGASVTAQNTTVRLTDVAGEIFTRTTFNGVTVLNANGPVTVENQNGSVSVESRGNRCQPLTLSTTFGPIRVTVPDGIGYNLAARTTFGRINSEVNLTLSGLVATDALAGTIGGGGCALRLQGQNGDISILKGLK